MYGWNDNRTDNERYLEQQLEDERRWRQEERERYQREREQRMAEYREQADRNNRQASSWPEALRKQIHLAGRETWDEGFSWLNYPGYSHDMYFTDTRAACKRALQIWTAEEAKVADEIAALKQKISELENSVRFAVGERLANEKQHHSSGWQNVASALTDPDCDPSEWLDW